MKTTVVNIRKEPYDVYIGRDKKNPYAHYGNPFPVIGDMSREQSISNFEAWLVGTDFINLEPERRRWILRNMGNLEGKRLGCFCKPLACHGDVYARLLDY